MVLAARHSYGTQSTAQPTQEQRQAPQSTSARKEIAAEEAAEKKKKSPGTGSCSSAKSPSGSRSRAPQGSSGGKPTYGGFATQYPRAPATM
eukprot:2903803-Rhodomonas_salina.1